MNIENDIVKINFSVLMSVYYKETELNLVQCLESLATQTLPATEIIIVKDGVLTDELENTLSEWQEKLPVKIVGYTENKGLIHALNYGLQFCSHELVARMDSDDICLSDRFKKQIEYLNKNSDIVLLSGYISEFNKEPNDMISIRKVPTGHSNIIKYLKKRNAFNHMAVIFKKSAVLAVGGYQGINGFEDYDLWIRLIQANYQSDNLQEVLVYVRVGNNMIARRHGLVYFKKEIDFIYRQRYNHFISVGELIILVLIRLPVRLIHPKILSFIYFNFLHKNNS